MDKETFWAVKSPLPQYQAIVFEHPAFDAPIRLVADQFEPVTLGGHVHQPVPMTIKPPDQAGDATAKLTLAFPRAVVGREFKRQLKLVRDAGSRAPIVVRYDVYLYDLTIPAVSWLLYIAEQGGVTFNAEAVQVSATVDNPMLKSSGLIYDPATFTGLEIL
ncbi:DUF1833 domain-containing protein [Acidovorax sp. Be4]|uniref:DUF1833 domain-containing protein n=1 Tax=Acidovorax bellezanensis TaxID=2976702 RepID=A0ABT2PPN1_9BURK|nr:DUF1833 domain-containing protein [Acidovorax sp. Be4]MCT9812411.1 DUF1833 domain-containing protein [Acidovorax sp. Be4]